MSLSIQKGKFVDEKGNVVPLEFGNIEQIAILRKLEARTENGEDVGVEMESLGWEGTIEFRCHACNHQVFKTFESEDEFWTSKEIPKTIECRNCKAKYTVKEIDGVGDVNVKLVK